MEDAYVLQLRNRNFSDFYLCFCGYAKCEPLHNFGPAVRPNYLIHLILEGKGKYIVDNNRYELEAGQGFLIEPEIQTFYEADKENPWTYLWIGFAGTRAKEYLEEIGLGNGRKTFCCSHLPELKLMLVNILKRNTYSLENEFLRQSFLYSFFAVLARDIEIRNAPENATENVYIRRAVEYIQNNYPNGIHVSDIAAYVGVSRGYLHTLFTKNIELSPQEYLINYRITRSKELLSVTELPIEGIAQSCGYMDTLAFSKLFKNKTGITPSQYRKENWDSRKNELATKKETLDAL